MEVPNFLIFGMLAGVILMQIGVIIAVLRKKAEGQKPLKSLGMNGVRADVQADEEFVVENDMYGYNL